MKTKINFASVLFAIGLIATACTSPAPTDSQPPSTTAPTVAATAAASGELAEWQGIPIMPGAIDGVETSEGYEFSTQATIEEITEFYESALIELGYSIDTSGIETDFAYWNFVKGSTYVGVAALTVGEVAQVKIARPATQSQVVPTATAKSLGEPATDWKGIPIMPGAVSGGEVGDEFGYEFTTPASLDEITQFYEAALAELGFTLTQTGENMGGVPGFSMLFEKVGSGWVNFNISAEADINLVTISVVPD